MSHEDFGRTLDIVEYEEVYKAYIHSLGRKMSDIKKTGLTLSTKGLLDDVLEKSLIEDFEQLNSSEVYKLLSKVKFTGSDGEYQIAESGNSHLQAFPRNGKTVFAYNIKVPLNSSLKHYRLLYEFDQFNNSLVFLRKVDVVHYVSLGQDDKCNIIYSSDKSKTERYTFKEGPDSSRKINKYITNIPCNGKGKKEAQIIFLDDEEKFCSEFRVKNKKDVLNCITFDAEFAVGNTGRHIPVIYGDKIPVDLLSELLRIDLKDLTNLRKSTLDEYYERCSLAFGNIGLSVMSHTETGLSL